MFKQGDRVLCIKPRSSVTSSRNWDLSTTTIYIVAEDKGFDTVRLLNAPMSGGYIADRFIFADIKQKITHRFLDVL